MFYFMRGDVQWYEVEFESDEAKFTWISGCSAAGKPYSFQEKFENVDLDLTKKNQKYICQFDTICFELF